MDEALSRGHRAVVDMINAFSAPARDVDEVGAAAKEGHSGWGLGCAGLHTAELLPWPGRGACARAACEHPADPPRRFSDANQPPLRCATPAPPPGTQADDVPDDAEEAGEGMDLELEGSRGIAPDQHAADAADAAPAEQPPQ